MNEYNLFYEMTFPFKYKSLLSAPQIKQDMCRAVRNLRCDVLEDEEDINRRLDYSAI